MGFPAEQYLSQKNGWEQAQNLAARVKADATNYRDRSNSGMDRAILIGFMESLSTAISRWQTIRSIPGVQGYARRVVDDNTLDLAAEFTAMVNTTTSLRDWIFDNFPKHTDGAWREFSRDNEGTRTALRFTAAQLADFRTQCDAVIATID